MKPLDQPISRKFRTIKTTIVPITIPILILFVALFSFFNAVPIVVSILLIIVSVVLFNLKEGVEVNIYNMEYRDIYTCFKISFGKWKKLGEFDFLLMSKTNKRSAIPINMAMTGSSSTIYFDIDLITKGDRDVLIYRNTNRETTLLFAKDLASELEIRLQEKVSGDFEWVV